MKLITIDTGSTTGVAAFSIFQKEGLERGDMLRIVRRPSLSQDAWMAVVMMTMAAANYFLKRRGSSPPPEADEFMRVVTGNDKGVVDLQEDLKKEFDVTVQVEPSDNDREFWREMGLHAMARGYSAEEPDISHITLLEPNPKYKPWKKGT